MKTTGDGNCLYRAASIHLCGTEEKHIELRVRSIVELATHYLADEDLLARIAAQERVLNMRWIQIGSVVNAEIINHVFEQEIIDSCVLNSWASIFISILKVIK